MLRSPRNRNSRLSWPACWLRQAAAFSRISLRSSGRWNPWSGCKANSTCQSEEVFAAADGFGVKPEMVEGDFGEALEFDGEKAEFVEGMVFQWIGRHLRLAQVSFGEGVGIDDKDAVGLEVGQIHLEGCGVHGDENIDGIARRVDLIRREVQLVAADAGESARRGADFGREIRESGDVVAVKGDRVGELAAGDLHAVAGVSGEANDGAVYNLALFRQR